jgi:hypothetical protein
MRTERPGHNGVAVDDGSMRAKRRARTANQVPQPLCSTLMTSAPAVSISWLRLRRRRPALRLGAGIRGNGHPFCHSLQSPNNYQLARLYPA